VKITLYLIRALSSIIDSFSFVLSPYYTKKMTDILKYICKRVGTTSKTTCTTTATTVTKKSATTTYVRSNIKRPYFAPYDMTEASVYRHRRQIGVNLGSIFILDKSLAPPSLRSCVVNDNWASELDFLESCMTLDQAKEALEDHWSSFVTEKDFEYLASIGINSVRIPIGYWILDCGGPFKKYKYVYQSAWYWFLNMISIAAKYKMGVLVDLHGAPGNVLLQVFNYESETNGYKLGGQNTFTRCGTSTGKTQFFKNSNQERTLKILKKLAVELAPINNVIGLNVLNKRMDDSSLPSFYLFAYKTIRQATNIMLPIYMRDGDNTKRCIDFIKRHRLEFVIVETTKCSSSKNLEEEAVAAASVVAKEKKPRSFIFNTSNNRSSSSLVSPPPSPTTSDQEQSLKQHYIQSHGNLIIGEWSASSSSLSEQQQQQQQRLKAYNHHSSGHYFWNYRTSDDGDASSFIYCQKKLKVLPSNLYGIIPMKCVEEISQLAKLRFDKYAVTHSSDQQQQQEVYRQGFSKGYKIALEYLELYQSQVGFKQQLAREYRTSDKSYEQGFFHALLAVDQSIREII
jgi:glucan 1,3-beta-glucosidase